MSGHYYEVAMRDASEMRLAPTLEVAAIFACVRAAAPHIAYCRLSNEAMAALFAAYDAAGSIRARLAQCEVCALGPLWVRRREVAA